MRNQDVIEGEQLDQELNNLEQQIPVLSDDEEMKSENLSLDEIDLQMPIDEEADTNAIAKDLLSEILDKLYAYIDEKQALNSKRKTWNLKRQEEQVAVVKQKRKEWRPEANSVQTKLRALFEDQEPSEQVSIPLALSLQ